MNVISELKTTLAEVRDSFNADYARQVLHDKWHLPFRERWRLVRETPEYRARSRTARIRGTWVCIVGLTPLLALALVKAGTRLLDGDAPPVVVVPVGAIYVLTAMACGWRIGSIRARHTLAQQDGVLK